jgi:putative effector of murein hydrolase LrgA (UPF0299 family)
VDFLFIPVLVATINTALLIVFDTIAVAVTLSNTIGTLRQLKEFKLSRAKSMNWVIVEQGK